MPPRTRLPGEATHSDSTSTAVRVPAAGTTATTFAAFGDSLMWGQGVARTHTFATVIARLAPLVLGNRTGTMVWDNSRSGAQITATREDRTGFLNDYPALFRPGETAKFIQGLDDTPATRLHGEVPATFPTIRGQVDMMPAATGRTIDVALVDGGVNDVSVADIVNPTISQGEYIERWDGLIRATAQSDVLDLLGRVRAKCPAAVILYFGFFAPLSYKSSTTKLRAAFKHETDDDIGWFVNGLFGCVNVTAAILEAQTRAMWMQGRWQYWTRQAVVAANHNATTRGAGVLFVPSGFGQANSAMASAPFLFDEFRQPYTDDMSVTRRQNIPRIGQLNQLESFYHRVVAPPASPPSDAELTALLAAVDGPHSLQRAISDYVGSKSTQNAIDLLDEVRGEILRIRHGIRASTGHPNRAGAQSYADNAVRRLRTHREALTRAATEAQAAVPPPGVETLDAMLRRYNLRGARPLEADLTHLDVDSLAVRVVNSPQSDRDFFPDVWLVVTTREPAGGASKKIQYLLNFVYRTVPVPTNRFWVAKPYPHFEPSATNRFTVDTEGTLRLEHIIGCSLLIGGDRLGGKQAMKTYGKVWRPSQVRLEVNGHEVVSLDTTGKSFPMFSSLDLGYPAARKVTVPPTLKPVEIRVVADLGPRTNADRARVPERPPAAMVTQPVAGAPRGAPPVAPAAHPAGRGG